MIASSKIQNDDAVGGKTPLILLLLIKPHHTIEIMIRMTITHTLLEPMVKLLFLFTWWWWWWYWWPWWGSPRWLWPTLLNDDDDDKASHLGFSWWYFWAMAAQLLYIPNTLFLFQIPLSTGIASLLWLPRSIPIEAAYPAVCSIGICWLTYWSITSTLAYTTFGRGTAAPVWKASKKRKDWGNWSDWGQTGSWKD